jgi:hypothetical protein
VTVRRRQRRAADVAAARDRHPTALWIPKVDEMRRRAADRAVSSGRIVTEPAYLHGDEPT